MRIRLRRFNLYLIVVLTAVVALGCGEKYHRKHQLSTLRVYLETSGEKTGRPVAVSRSEQVMFNVENEPFLTEVLVKKADVINTMGGFALSVEFERKGSWLLEQYTSGSKGKHLVIFSAFVPPGTNRINEGRWLAAPTVKQRMTDGIITFTPDASRPETEAIARGLNNLARKLNNDFKLW
jgi:hypothetical protein